MGNGNTIGNQSHGPHAAEGRARSAVMWVAWTIGLVIVIAVALVCVPWVIVWCLLFDAD